MIYSKVKVISQISTNVTGKKVAIMVSATGMSALRFVIINL